MSGEEVTIVGKIDCKTLERAIGSTTGGKQQKVENRPSRHKGGIGGGRSGWNSVD